MQMPLTPPLSRSSMVPEIWRSFAIRRDLWERNCLQVCLEAWLSSSGPYVAHDVLPLGKAGIKEIPNEQIVLSSMKANMPEDGLYFLPGLGLPENATRAQQAAAMEARMHKVETGPSGLLVYHPALNFSFGKALGVELELTSFKSCWRFPARPNQSRQFYGTLALYYSRRHSCCHQHQHFLLELVWLSGKLHSGLRLYRRHGFCVRRPGRRGNRKTRSSRHNNR